MRRTVERTKKILAIAAIACIASVVSFRSSASTTAAAADAAATYKTKCATCHGADGSGHTATGKALKLRDLRSAEVQGQSDDQLLAIISKGKGKMPAYQKILGAATCKALVGHIRKLGGR